MRTEKVNFYSESIKLAGVLYLPRFRSGQTLSRNRSGTRLSRTERRQTLHHDVRKTLCSRVRLPLFRLPRLGR